MKYYRFRWNENPGMEKAHWGESWWFFEVGPDGYCSRQIELYDSGPRLRYHEGHAADGLGILSDQPITENDLRCSEVPPFSDVHEIAAEEFDAVWNTGSWSNDTSE